MKQITDRAILDNIVEQLINNDTLDGTAFANYVQGDIEIDASVKWYCHEEENWVTIDGRSYYEGTYDVCDGFDDLFVDAWIGDEKVDIDIDYIKKHLH